MYKRKITSDKYEFPFILFKHEIYIYCKSTDDPLSDKNNRARDPLEKRGQTNVIMI